MFKSKPLTGKLARGTRRALGAWVSLAVSASGHQLAAGRRFLITRARARVGGRRSRLLTAVALAVVVGLAATAVFKPAMTAAATSSTINFQARLENAGGSIAADGTYNVEFKLYSALTGGSALWTEDYLVASSTGISVSNGYLTANLGSQTAFPSTIDWSQQLYLTMNIGGTSSTPSWDGEMSPRLLVTSVPYAFRAGQATQVVNTSGSYTSTLSLATPSGGSQTLQVKDQGASGTYTLCVQGATTANGGCAPTSGGSGYIQSAPASIQTGANFYIQANASTVGGVIRANGADTLDLQNSGGNVIDKFDSSGNLTIGASASAVSLLSNGAGNLTIDTGGAATLNLGNSNASSIAVGGAGTSQTISIGNGTGGGTINIGHGTGTTAINIGYSGDTTAIQGGTSSLTLNSTGIIGQSNTNSSTAFQIQNSNSIPIFLVDTTTTNLLSNPGFETGYSGWGVSGTGASLAPNTVTADVYNGLASLAITTASSSTTTVTVSSFTSSLPAGNYAFSFEAMGNASVTLGSTVTFSGGGTCTLNSTSVSSSGFQLYRCTVTTTSSTSSISFTISTNSVVMYLDAVQLTATSTVMPYRIGAVQLRGLIDNPVTLQATSKSTSALSVYTPAGAPVLSVDTLDGYVQIGSQTANSLTNLLVLNNYSNGTTEPSPVTGAMYYNSAFGAFRCGVNGAWVNCAGQAITNTAIASAYNGSSTSEQVWTPGTNINANGGQTYVLPANYCTAGRVYEVVANGVYSTTTTAESLVFKVKLGTTVAGATTTVTPPASQSGLQWSTQFDIMCESATSAIAEGQTTIAGSSLTSTQYAPMTNSAAVTIPSTSTFITMSVTFAGTTSSSNTVTLQQLIVHTYGT